jgi:hypothetical protein
MLTPILATDDPYAAAASFAEAGWSLKGAGVEFHVSVPAAEIETIHAAHSDHADSTTELLAQPWGERAFHTTIIGYRFLIAAESAT